MSELIEEQENLTHRSISPDPIETKRSITPESEEQQPEQQEQQQDDEIFQRDQSPVNVEQKEKETTATDSSSSTTQERSISPNLIDLTASPSLEQQQQKAELSESVSSEPIVEQEKQTTLNDSIENERFSTPEPVRTETPISTETSSTPQPIIEQQEEKVVIQEKKVAEKQVEKEEPKKIDEPKQEESQQKQQQQPQEQQPIDDRSSSPCELDQTSGKSSPPAVEIQIPSTPSLDQKDEEVSKLTAQGTRVPWVDDSASNACQKCNIDFNWYRRRHHCRNCGALVCYECSGNQAELPAASGYTGKVRVCNPCFKSLKPVTPSVENVAASTQTPAPVAQEAPTTTTETKPIEQTKPTEQKPADVATSTSEPQTVQPVQPVQPTPAKSFWSGWF